MSSDDFLRLHEAADEKLKHLRKLKRYPYVKAALIVSIVVNCVFAAHSALSYWQYRTFDHAEELAAYFPLTKNPVDYVNRRSAAINGVVFGQSSAELLSGQIDLGNDASLHFGLNSFTILMWLKIDELNPSERSSVIGCFSTNSPPASANGWSVSVANKSEVQARFQSGFEAAEVTDATYVKPGVWTLIGFSVDRTDKVIRWIDPQLGSNQMPLNGPMGDFDSDQYRIGDKPGVRAYISDLALLRRSMKHDELTRLSTLNRQDFRRAFGITEP